MTDSSSAFTIPLVGALARLGVRHVCITPGSRSTALALAFADEPSVSDWSHHDERSSAFFALGIARTLREPVAIVTTSGTAAAELHPALAEARHARAALIAITADRPFELRDLGAPQTMDQQGLFGKTVKWAHDIEAAADVEPTRVVALAARLVAEATDVPAGPVHLNVRYREPLMPSEEPPETPDPPAVVLARRDPSHDAIAEIATAAAGRRGMIVVGPQNDPSVVTAAPLLAAAAGWPILADALSGLRCGTHDRSAVVAAGDPLAWEGWLDRASPEFVVRVGALPTSKPIWQWLESARRVPQVLVEPAGWRDPMASATTVIRADPARTLEALAKTIDTPSDPSWLAAWRRADQAADDAIGAVLDEARFPNEPALARLVGRAAPDRSTLWVGSSMPVRDVDAFLESTDRRVRVMGNRGVNGIDGLISAALGSAAASGGPTIVLAGDLSVLHDLGALATAGRLGIPATIVVINNDGGGIFHFLPQEGHPHFERHFATPHGLDFTAVAPPLGVAAERIEDPEALAEAIATTAPGPRLLEVRTDRGENVVLHRDLRAAVAGAIADL